MARRDEDALSWGDDDPTLDDGTAATEADDWEDPEPAPAPDATAERARPAQTPVQPATPPAASRSTVTATVTGPDGVVRTREVVHPHTDDRKRPRAGLTARGAGEDASDEPVDAAPLGNVALVSLGVLGGIYALFAVGWFFAGSRFQVWAAISLDPIAYVGAWALATAAPVVWFVSVLVLARRRPVWLRIVLLIVGVVVLLPWPFLLTGASA